MEWGSKESFSNRKQALFKASVLVSPDYGKEISFFSFACAEGHHWWFTAGKSGKCIVFFIRAAWIEVANLASWSSHSESPFLAMGLSFIGQFHQNSSNGFSWILTATDYLTTWVEAVPLKTSSSTSIVRFAESSNKNLIKIINKVVGENKRAWDGLP